MQVAARFVSGGRGRTTLAGPQAQVTLLGLRGFRAAPGASLRERFDVFVANVRARIEAGRIRRELRKLLPAGSQVTLDTSPRPPSPGAAAIPVQSGWAPAPQSPSTAAEMTVGPTSGGAPYLPALNAGQQIAPNAVGFPATYWRDVIQRGLPPMVAARGEHDALRAWFSNRLPGQGW